MAPLRLLLCVAMAVPLVALSQSITPITVEYQATTSAPNGEVKGCGLRFVGVAPIGDSTTQAEVIDASISTYRDIGMVKAGLFVADLTAANAEARTPAGLIDWVRVGESQALASGGGRTPSENVGYATYLVKDADAARSLQDLAKPKPMWISFQVLYGGSRIYAVDQPLGPAVAKQYGDCLKQLKR